MEILIKGQLNLFSKILLRNYKIKHQRRTEVLYKTEKKKNVEFFFIKTSIKQEQAKNIHMKSYLWYKFLDEEETTNKFFLLIF